MTYKVAVLTISDKGAAGLREDKSGPEVAKLAEKMGYEVAYTGIIPDEIEEIKKEFIRLSDDPEIAMILSTGGTGFAPRDVTPEATIAVCEKMCPGIAEQMRAESRKITNRACLSRAVSGIRKSCLIINLPGSPVAAVENLIAVIPALSHGLDMLRENDSECAAKAHN